ncbi:MAG: ABC transporter ATP-binding protein [Gammaproteobacteria bacterium]|jgi:branched-chain amino acid transport system ATP-binding protein|nr:ABC transporter ATP-binding protein [Gammaproteobacteria bacterium]
MSDIPFFSIRHLYAGYGPIHVLHDISLDINKNEIVALIGANGAGKSTLLMSIFAQPKIFKGEILFQGLPIHHLETHAIAKLGIAISPERRRIFPKMTVEENLLIGGFSQPKITIKQNIEKAYVLFPILKERKKQNAGTLSGGEQQMLSMGRSLMSSPKLFLLDEPSLGLAPQVVMKIFQILSEIAKMGTTILLVEQNAYHALNLAHKGFVLQNGKIQLSGTGKELLANKEVQTAYLGGIF